jgi:hypothetical protein
MRSPEAKCKTCQFTSSALSGTIKKNIPTLVPTPASTPCQQETRMFSSGADDKIPTEESIVPKTPSLRCCQKCVGSFTALDTKFRTEIAVQPDENGLDFKSLDWNFNIAANPLSIKEPLDWCCPVSKRKTSPEAPQLYQSKNSKRRKACK